jgi:hypothetical protein
MPESPQHPAGPAVRLGVVGRLGAVGLVDGVAVAGSTLALGLVGAGGEDVDGPFAPADLVAEGLPRPVPHHDAGVGPLGEDEQLVAERTLREAGGHRQPALPPLPRHQLGHPGLDLGLHCFDPVPAHRITAEAAMPSVMSVRTMSVSPWSRVARSGGDTCVSLPCTRRRAGPQRGQGGAPAGEAEDERP